jgi:hypothetical protein
VVSESVSETNSAERFKSPFFTFNEAHHFRDFMHLELIFSYCRLAAKACYTCCPAPAGFCF